MHCMQHGIYICRCSNCVHDLCRRFVCQCRKDCVHNMLGWIVLQQRNNYLLCSGYLLIGGGV